MVLCERKLKKAGGLRLVYIDPPFSAGLDYSVKVEVGNNKDIKEEFIKSPSVLEEFAYRNTWGNGGNTFISMLFERVQLIKDILSNDGIFFLRIDHHWGHYVKVMLDEIFGKNYFQSEIVVNRIKKNITLQGKPSLPVSVDSLFVYFKSNNSKFIHIGTKRDKIREGYWRRTDDSAGESSLRERHLFGKVFYPPAGKHFKFSQKRMDEMVSKGILRFNEKLNRLEYYVLPSDIKILDTNWTDIPGYSFTTGYPTENSEKLLERIIDICTKKGDFVADFFCGSGTTCAVAEQLGRKWIGVDLGKFAIHTTRKRMISVQREMKKSGKNFRAFEVLNLGKYERQHYIGVNLNLREKEQEKQLAEKEKDYIKLILKAYKSQSVKGFKTFSAKKTGRMVAIGNINFPVGRLFVEEIIKECLQKQITKADVLSFEYEMGLFPRIQEEAKAKGINLDLKYIPKEVFDKQAVEKNQIQFHDVSYIEIKPHVTKNKVSVELTDFSVYYNQEIRDNIVSSLKKGKSRITVEKGHIVKISKDKNNIVSHEVLTKRWTDWIDYWAVDFDFESKKEIVRIKNEKGEIEEKWTGDYVFENEWQSFRTKKDRSIELRSIPFECKKGRRKIAVKVVDIFGNDTMKVIPVQV